MAEDDASQAQPDDEQGGQSLFAEEETTNAKWDEFDERPAECTPVGPTPPFELISEFFEGIADMRNNKRTAGGTSGAATKKRALIHAMFTVHDQLVVHDRRLTSSFLEVES